jgi:hypothetical protein
MMPEVWGVVASLLLALAIAFRGLVLYQVRGPWALLTVGGRVGGMLALAAALVVSAIANGEWSPLDLRQITLGLTLATLIVYQALAWRFAVEAGAPAVDLVALAMILTGILVVRPGGALLTCDQRSILFYVQWILSLLGAGGIVAAGSAGVTFALRAAAASRDWDLQWPRRLDLHRFVGEAVLLALVALGGGLVAGLGRVWWTLGTVAGDDPRVAWFAITWLLAAASALARCLPKWWGRWAAGLAVVAAASAIFGLVFLGDVRGLLGM